MKIVKYCEFIADNKTYSENSTENDYFQIKDNVSDNNVIFQIKPKKNIVLKKFSIEFDFFYNPEAKIFCNGYQSWTISGEYKIEQKIKPLSRFAKIINPFFNLSQYGDYTFFEKEVVDNTLYSFSFAYIKNNNKYKLFFSRNEHNVSTIFQFLPQTNKLKVIVDCDEVVVNDNFTLIDFEIFEGDYCDLKKYLKNIYKVENNPVTGWTSWYNYYQNISESIILQNLEEFSKIYPEKSVFQIDDGFQTFVGDWLDLDLIKFPNGLKNIVDKIHSNNYTAGLWLAPFAVEKKSKLANSHPEWLLRDKTGKLVVGGSNWSSFYVLDFYNQNARDYLKTVFKTVLDDWNFDLVKLDFLYAIAIIPQNGKSRAKIMTEAMDFLRQIVGNKKILACGVPLAQAFGKVDYCRIGADIGLTWNGKFYEKYLHRERVSTYNTLKNTMFRHFIDQSVFLNDPDVFLLRDNNIKLSENQKITVYLINLIFGSLVFTSDDFLNYKKQNFELIKNTNFWINSEILSLNEINDVFEYEFIANNTKYQAFSNLTEKQVEIKPKSNKKVNFYNLKIEISTENFLKPFETIIYEL